MSNPLETYDVLIVGAGFSGLMAARELHRAGKRIRVFEARDRVGGRIHTRWLDKKTYVDLGGQWIGPTQDEMYSLLAEYGLSHFPTYQTGQSLTYMDGKLKSYKGLIPPLPVPALLNLDFAIKRLNRLSAQLDLTQPWTHPKAEAWDQQSLTAWMNRIFRFRKASRLFQIGIESIYALDPAELSLLHTLVYCAGGGNLNRLLDIENGAQQDRIYGGAQSLADHIAAEFKTDIQLSTPILHVQQNEHDVRIQSATHSWQAAHLILALPPLLARKINFSPTLPADRQMLLDQYVMGSVVKCYAIYERPFWREDNLNGLVATDEGFLSVVFDNSPRDGERGMLMGFVLADKARRFGELNVEKRQALVLGELSRYFGPSALRGVSYMDKVWAEEEFSGGCYAGMLGPGAWTRAQDHLGLPTGRIHWAGTETATEWNGYMEGAIQAGKRAAKEILKKR